MRAPWFLFIVPAIVIVIMACEGGGDAGSCFREKDNTCTEYAGSQGAAAKRLCSGMTWAAGERSCPTANRLGTCVKRDGADYVFGGVPNNYSASSAKIACESAGGVFTPNPAER